MIEDQHDAVSHMSENQTLHYSALTHTGMLCTPCSILYEKESKLNDKSPNNVHSVYIAVNDYMRCV